MEGGTTTITAAAGEAGCSPEAIVPARSEGEDQRRAAQADRAARQVAPASRKVATARMTRPTHVAARIGPERLRPRHRRPLGRDSESGDEPEQGERPTAEDGGEKSRRGEHDGGEDAGAEFRGHQASEEQPVGPPGQGRLSPHGR